MATTRKVTFTLPSDLVEHLDQHAAAHGRAGNKSALVADALREKITRDRYLERVRDAWGDIDPELLARAKADLAGSPAAAPQA